METGVRDYLIAELEIARNHTESYKETTTMMRSNLVDCEYQLDVVSSMLCEKLALAETVCETQVKARCQVECELQRLVAVMDSYLEGQEVRIKTGGNESLMPPTEYKNIDEATKNVQELYEKINKYKETSDQTDNTLRSRCRDHIQEVERLEAIISSLEGRLESKSAEAAHQTERAIVLQQAVELCALNLVTQEGVSTAKLAEAWETVARLNAKLAEVDLSLKRITPLMLAGMQHSNGDVANICNAVVDRLRLSTEAEVAAIRLAVIKEAERQERERLEALMEYKKSLTKGAKGKPGSRGNAGNAKDKGKGGATGGGTKADTGGTDKANLTDTSDTEGKNKKGAKGGAKAADKKPAAGGKDAKGKGDSKSQTPSRATTPQRSQTPVKKKK
jgi:hypothetical protein